VFKNSCARDARAPVTPLHSLEPLADRSQDVDDISLVHRRGQWVTQIHGQSVQAKLKLSQNGLTVVGHPFGNTREKRFEEVVNVGWGETSDI
jgi:hypothetical protein|tara:strand:- start:588 stop:863 length:276 start_codon:yes stop_codon:yes gene_type:complete